MHVAGCDDPTYNCESWDDFHQVLLEYDSLGAIQHALIAYDEREACGLDDAEGAPLYGDPLAPPDLVAPRFDTGLEPLSPLTPLTPSPTNSPPLSPLTPISGSVSGDDSDVPQLQLLPQTPTNATSSAQENVCHASSSASAAKKRRPRKAQPSVEQRHKKNRKRNERRAKSRQIALAKMEDLARPVRPSTSLKSAHIHAEPVDYSVYELKRTRFSFTCLRPRPLSAQELHTGEFPFVPGQTFSFHELVHEHGFRRIEWDGRLPKVLTDRHSVVFAALCGRPSNEAWSEVATSADRTIEAAGMKLKASCDKHRRGAFPAIIAGVSHGGGRQAPGNLALTKGVARVMERLVKSKELTRLAGYQDSCLGWYMPKIKLDMVRSLRLLLNSNGELRRPFLNSMYPACSVNFGPRTVCFDHRDFSNAPGVPCAVTSLGDFDPTHGGHLVLYDLRLAIEFPPGSTILLPSGALRHGNTTIAAHETRRSFTQFCPGGLLCYVTYGMRNEAQLNPGEKEQILGDLNARWLKIAGLFSKADELHQDRMSLKH